MNKAPQPIGGPPGAPHPAPSPGLQPAFLPGPAAPVVFGPPQATQMNTPSQPRQGGFRSLQQFFPNRPQPPSSTSRVQSNPQARAVTPVFTMIPQQLTYGSQPSYYIQGQYRTSYVGQTQQYPVQPTPPGFYPGTSAPDYSFSAPYYAAQGVQQYPASVAAAPVLMNQPQVQPKRERKPIRIRDPNQGGKDITEEIMSGGRSTFTPTPPQVVGDMQANGETPYPVTVVIRPDDRPKPTLVLPKEHEIPALPVTLPLASLEEDYIISEVDTKPDLSDKVPALLDSGIVNTISTATVSSLEDASLLVSDSVELVADVPSEIVEELVSSKVPYTAASELELQISANQEVTGGESLTGSLPEMSESVLHTQVESEILPEEPVLSELKMEVCVHEAVFQTETMECPISEPEELTPVNVGTVAHFEPEGQGDDLESDINPIAEPEEVRAEAVESTCSDTKVVETLEAPLQEETQLSVVVTAVAVTAPSSEPPMQAAVAVQKKKRKMKDLNKKGAVGDLLDAFKEPQVNEVPREVETQSTPPVAAAEEKSLPAQEEVEETWEEKEDRLDAEYVKPETVLNADQKYKYKEENWKPLNPEEKKIYDREFLLGFQFINASMQKPEGLPHISDVVLDKANRNPIRPLDPAKLSEMNCGPDFTPHFANLGRQSSGSRGPELFRKVRSILNKLTPQMFQQLMKQVTDLTVDTEERLKGVIDLIFEKAISEPNFSVAYANMCRCLMGVSIFQGVSGGTSIFQGVTKESVFTVQMHIMPEEKARLREALEDARDKARRRSLGNIKFIGELFKLKMLTEPIMHDCIVKLLKNHDEESLECLCRLLTTIGKDLDFEKAKPRMDQYFNQMGKIIKERKTSSRIRFMLQDVIDLRLCNWVPRRGDLGPKTIDQIHKEAEMEEQMQHIKVQQQLLMKQDKRRVPPSREIGGGRGAPNTDDGWNTVPISKGSRPIDPSRLKITKPGTLDCSNQLLAPGGRLASWGKGSSGGSGTKPSETATESGRPGTSTLNRFSALQQSSSGDSLDSRRVVQRNSSSRERNEKGDRERYERTDRYDRGSERSDRFDRSERIDRFERPERGEKVDRSDKNRPLITKRSFGKESEDRSREREKRPSQEPIRKAASAVEEREKAAEVDRVKEPSVKREPGVAPAVTKPALSEEEVEKKSKAILEEFLHINDMKEAVQCVQEMNSAQHLYIFVRDGIESTLERSTIAREHMGLLLHQLVKVGILPRDQYYKGIREILEVAEDMEIDIPHIWQYLAELITPLLHEGGIPMGELFREVAKPLVSIGKAAVLLVEVLSLLCKGMSHKKAGMLWREAGLSWKEFLPEDIDVNKFVTDKNVEFTMGEDSEMSSKKELSMDELCRHLDKLLKENADNQRIYDWIEVIRLEYDTFFSCRNTMDLYLFRVIFVGMID
ncbi:eukaryotic translation initiation factor 4 gamma 1-like [Protopterus annectens]|uniref:eukaryotic translation initiation factor 4 gamma 1-like n=1 Tax=Protopterus annectens TaxID=7888 RepID=UPI001CF99154|nr:eukaryotic translation initiation factor 4 gamma 1-like [Protopterus annectens]